MKYRNYFAKKLVNKNNNNIKEVAYTLDFTSLKHPHLILLFFKKMQFSKIRNLTYIKRL